MTRFAVMATTKIAKITAKTVPVNLLLTRSPKRIKSEVEFVFFTDIIYDSAEQQEAANTRGKKERENTSYNGEAHNGDDILEATVQIKFSSHNARENQTQRCLKSVARDMFLLFGEQPILYCAHIYVIKHSLCITKFVFVPT